MCENIACVHKVKIIHHWVIMYSQLFTINLQKSDEPLRSQKQTKQTKQNKKKGKNVMALKVAAPRHEEV